MSSSSSSSTSSSPRGMKRRASTASLAESSTTATTSTGTANDAGSKPHVGRNFKPKKPKPTDPARLARLEARQARNRASAQVSRDRKKMHVSSLEADNERLTKENEHLRARDRAQATTITALHARVHTLEHLVKQLLKVGPDVLAASSVTAQPQQQQQQLLAHLPPIGALDATSPSSSSSSSQLPTLMTAAPIPTIASPSLGLVPSLPPSTAESGPSRLLSTMASASSGFVGVVDASSAAGPAQLPSHLFSASLLDPVASSEIAHNARLPAVEAMRGALAPCTLPRALTQCAGRSRRQSAVWESRWRGSEERAAPALEVRPRRRQSLTSLAPSTQDVADKENLASARGASEKDASVAAMGSKVARGSFMAAASLSRCREAEKSQREGAESAPSASSDGVVSSSSSSSSSRGAAPPATSAEPTLSSPVSSRSSSTPTVASATPAVIKTRLIIRYPRALRFKLARRLALGRPLSASTKWTNATTTLCA